MRILVAQHDDDTPHGAIGDALVARGFALDLWCPRRGDAPAPIEAYDGMLGLGSITNPDEDAENPWLARERALIARAIEIGVPYLGTCFGGQILAQAAGGRAFKSYPPEIGWYEIERLPAADGDPVLGTFEETFWSFEWHHYAFQAPAGATVLARTSACEQAFRVGDSAWGTQFHLEADFEILSEWFVLGHDEAHTHGVDVKAMRAESERRNDEHVRLAHRMGHGFADVVERVAARRAAIGARS